MSTKYLKIVLITIGIIVILISGTKVYQTIVFFRNGPPPIDHSQDSIQPWMSVAFLAKQVNQSESQIFEILQIPHELQNPDVPLGKIEKKMQLPRGTLLTKANGIVTQYAPTPVHEQ